MSTRYFSAVKDNRNLIALFDIRCAGNDLNGSAADIDLTDDQLIRIGMLFNL